jgi:hypothetical protein
LARDLMAKAAVAEDREIAARLRERAEEYLLLARAVQEEPQPPAPPTEPNQPAMQQQQQIQPDQDDDDKK